MGMIISQLCYIYNDRGVHMLKMYSYFYHKLGNNYNTCIKRSTMILLGAIGFKKEPHHCVRLQILISYDSIYHVRCWVL